MVALLTTAVVRLLTVALLKNGRAMYRPPPSSSMATAVVVTVAMAALTAVAGVGVEAPAVAVEIDGAVRYYHGADGEAETQAWCVEQGIDDTRCGAALAHEVREQKRGSQPAAAAGAGEDDGDNNITVPSTVIDRSDWNALLLRGTRRRRRLSSAADTADTATAASAAASAAAITAITATNRRRRHCQSRRDSLRQR